MQEPFTTLDLVLAHHAAEVDVLNRLHPSLIQLVHPSLLVLVVDDAKILERAEKGARRRPNDQVWVLGLYLLPNRRPVLRLREIPTICQINRRRACVPPDRGPHFNGTRSFRLDAVRRYAFAPERWLRFLP